MSPFFLAIKPSRLVPIKTVDFIIQITAFSKVLLRNSVAIGTRA
jgi:hypothetical protein